MFENGAKYIVIPVGNKETIIIFSTLQKHSWVAERMGFEPDEIIAAGFVDNDLKTHGSSMSLGVGSREEDDRLVEIAFGKGI